MSEEFIAKDYWAMTMLAEVMKRSEILVFKGGTCLSKCYGAINRFSEDVDLGIPAAALGMGPERLLSDGQTFGLLFESLCVHDLRAYAACLPGAHPWSLRYYGDSDGLEVDVIIELRDGRWAALEVKLGEAKVPDGIRNIERLREKVASNPAARNPEPEFSAVVTATSPFCRHDAEHDVYVFPITALRP